MVLFKRKPVGLIPHPLNIKDDAEVWVIAETGEIFTDYEKYLKRYDFLHQKKFTDAINGKSGLTYADAVASENQSLAEIENVFPDVLRDPILRKVQFSTVGRMDELVNWIYDEFKREFFPGEDVLVTLQDRDITSGSIREKAKFPMIRGPDGSIQRNAFARYFIRLHDPAGDEALVDENNVRRDRKVYSKMNIRAFLKNSLNREPYLHAPWLVKEPLAHHYRISTHIPPHLLKDANNMNNPDQRARAPRGRNQRPEDVARMQQEAQRQQHMQRQGQHGGALPQHPARQQVVPQVIVPPPKPAPPPIKYPIEDLDVAPKREWIVRPQLSFLTEEMANYVKNNRSSPIAQIRLETTGMLLEIWNTLNVQCEVYEIDSFTFDDFVDAMGFTTESENTECQLLDEAFCAVMKQLVDETGKVQVSLPQMVEEDEDSSESAIDDSNVSTPVADVPARSTRSRLSHVENVSEHSRSPAGPPVKMHRAQEALVGFDWVATLGARDMAAANWHLILVGILYQLSQVPHFKATCDKVLSYLVPLDMDPEKENIKFQFKTMNIDLRAAALQPLTMLSTTTKALKKFLEDCSEDQTEVRKRKMEYQRERRTAGDALHLKSKDKAQVSEAVNAAEAAEAAAAAAIADAAAAAANSSEPEEEQTSTSGRSNRRSLKRKRANEMTPQEKERKAAHDAAKTAADKKRKEFQALVRDIDLLKQQILDLEAQIVDCDSDLREADVQRTRMLGKDRYCNRYWWLERNGQPHGGLPTSSTADYGYSNGRIWVQGPDTMEREGFIDLPADEQAAYKAKFNVTVPERRRFEEGPTSLMNANEWACIDDPSVLDALIAWLDDRGEREKKLRKELFEWHDKIVKFMRARKEFLDAEAAKKLEADEEPKKGIATRRQAEQEKAEAGERCLRWKNTMGLERNNHLHCESPPPKKPKKKSAKEIKETKEAKEAAAAATSTRTSRSRAR